MKEINLKLIKGYENFVKIEKINYGWSTDQKFDVTTNDNRRLLLRISDLDSFDKKKKEFDALSLFAKATQNMSLPVAFGKTSDYTYMLLKWVEGESLENKLPEFDEKTQYELGVSAGKILKAIHSVEYPSTYKYTSRKAKKIAQLDRYISSNLRIPNDEKIIQYVKDNIDLFDGRPPCLLHGDFHAGNLVIDSNNQIGVIDFNRYSIGDPYSEFYKTELFSSKVSVPFAVGEINGYFDNNVPDDFWAVLRLHVAHASIYSIVWAEPFGQKDIDNMIKICYQSIDDYDNFDLLKPKWYENYQK